MNALHPALVYASLGEVRRRTLLKHFGSLRKLRAATPEELADLLFAFRVSKHVKSNAIVYAKGGKTVGIGAGQMSRIDSSRIAAWKAKEAGTEAIAHPRANRAGCQRGALGDGVANVGGEEWNHQRQARDANIEQLFQVGIGGGIRDSALSVQHDGDRQ